MIDFFSLIPILLVLVGSISLMILSTFNLKISTFLWVSFGFLFVALLASIISINSLFSLAPFANVFNKLIIYDSFSNTFSVMLLLGSILYLGAGENFARAKSYMKGEYFSLVLFGVFGMLLLASSNELITALVALEIASCSVYILVGFNTKDASSSEAMFKYLTLGSFVGGFYILGVALIYLVADSTNLSDITVFIATANYQEITLVYVGFSLIIFMFLFKMASFPFGLWSLDVYKGAPLYTTSFMASVFKISIFAFFLRLFMQSIHPLANDWNMIFEMLSILAFVFGSIITLAQQNIVKMLAGSSIVNAGYLLMAFMSLGSSLTSVGAIMFYLLAYMLASIGILGVLSYLSAKEGRDIATYEDIKGMATNNPFIAVLMSIFMLSLAGIPLTMGFVAKLNVFIEAINIGYYMLVFVAILAAMVSVYYYMRVILCAYSKVNNNFTQAISVKESLMSVSYYSLSVIAIIIIWLGISSSDFIIGKDLSINGIFNIFDISTISILAR